jgi:hypothetical protein
LVRQLEKEFISEKTFQEIILKKDRQGEIMGIGILNFLPKPEEKLEVIEKFVPIKVTAKKP